jgi:hypothetical protein
LFATTSIANHLCLHPDCLSLISPPLSISSACRTATTVSTTFPIQLSRTIERYVLSLLLLSFLGLQLSTRLAWFDQAGCQPLQTTVFTSCTILTFSQCQSDGMAPNDSFSGPRDNLTHRPKKVCLAASFITYWCGYATMGCLKSWSCCIGGKASCLSRLYFSALKFAWYPSLCVRASTIASVRGLVNFAALQSSTPFRFFRKSFHILCFALQTGIHNSALTCAVAADLLFLHLSLRSWHHLYLIMLFLHLVDRVQILTFLAVEVTCLVQHGTSGLHSRSCHLYSLPSSMPFPLPTLSRVSAPTPCSPVTWLLVSTLRRVCLLRPPASPCSPRIL